MSQDRSIVDKSGMNRKAHGGRTRADPQSSETTSRSSGVMDSRRSVKSRPGSTARASRSLKNVPARKR